MRKEMGGVWERCMRNGLMAEWLGKGLQNLVQRFESASDLKEGSRFADSSRSGTFFIMIMV